MSGDIVNIIGVKRIVVILFLLVAIGGAVAIQEEYLAPEITKAERALNATNARVAALRHQLETFDDRLRELRVNQEMYDKLGEKGFFSGQDRVDARSMFEQLRNRAGLLNLNYSVKPAEKFDHNKIRMVQDEVLIYSELTMRGDSFQDDDLFRLITLIDQVYPGQTTLRSMKLRRDRRLNQENIQAAEEEPVSFMSGEIVFDWFTLGPKFDEDGDTINYGRRTRR